MAFHDLYILRKKLRQSISIVKMRVIRWQTISQQRECDFYQLNRVMRMIYGGGFMDRRKSFVKQAQFDDVNKGRCGECGDMWSIPRPRPNDEGGLYGTGLIARNYTAGEVSI